MAGARFKEILKKYGKVGIGVHMAVSTVSITGFYVAIKNNVDVESLLAKWNLPGVSSNREAEADEVVVSSGSEDGSSERKNRTAAATSAGGAFAIALLCNKALFPLRVPITIALTPPISRFLARRRLIKTNV